MTSATALKFPVASRSLELAKSVLSFQTWISVNLLILQYNPLVFNEKRTTWVDQWVDFDWESVDFYWFVFGVHILSKFQTWNFSPLWSNLFLLWQRTSSNCASKVIGQLRALPYLPLRSSPSLMPLVGVKVSGIRLGDCYCSRLTVERFHLPRQCMVRCGDGIGPARVGGKRWGVDSGPHPGVQTASDLFCSVEHVC